jgi:hypothetical protein
MDWATHVAREERRYRDGLARIPEQADARQRQLVRVANAACGAGLASLMAGRDSEAREWFRRASGWYRHSYDFAPPDSYGRLIAVVKMAVMAGGPAAASAEASWALEQIPRDLESPIGRYAACLALLVLKLDDEARTAACMLLEESPERFPTEVAQALAGLATGDAELYGRGLDATLRSFETRNEHLEDVPVSDTVLVLERLAAERGIARRPASAVLPPLGNF